MILPPLDGSIFLASYFTGNGESGARFATSVDGLIWKPLDGPHVPATAGEGKIVRDPCFFEGPRGEWRIVWTSDWWSRDLGVAKLENGRWSAPRLVESIGPDGAQNVWAPEATWDPKAKRYWVYWSSTVPGAFPRTEGKGDDHDHRFYAATTRDFVRFSPTKLFWDPGFNCIDATIVPWRGSWLMVAKDERKSPVVKKSLFAATAPAIEGPWTIVARDLGGRNWIEGPTVVDLGDRVRVYFDDYTKGKWGALESRDLRVWSDLGAKIRMVPGARHGTVRRVPRTFVEAMETASER